MDRLRYYHLACERRVPEIVQAIRRAPYTEEVPNGFIVDRLRSHLIQARFISLNQTEKTIVDPFGDSVTEVRREFRVFRFQLWPKARLLEVENQPAAFADFHHRIGEAVGALTTPLPLRLDLTRLLALLGEEPGFDLVRVRVGQIALSARVGCEVIVGGTQSVWADLEELLARRSYVLREVALRFSAEGEHVEVEATAGGVLRCSRLGKRLRTKLKSAALASESK